MKLEELTKIISDCNEVRVVDTYNAVIAKYNGKDSIPPYLDDIEVLDIKTGHDGTMFVYVDCENPENPVCFIKSEIADLENAFADKCYSDLGCVNHLVEDYMREISADSKKIADALHDGVCWDAYVDY